MLLTAREVQQIDAAILAHSKWITDLKVAIEDGTSEFDPETVKTDNHCDFGKWLYDGFPQAAQNSAVFQDIRATHAAFHRTAAHILTLAMSGHKEHALELMDLRGEFMQLSAHLIFVLKGLLSGRNNWP